MSTASTYEVGWPIAAMVSERHATWRVVQVRRGGGEFSIVLSACAHMSEVRDAAGAAAWALGGPLVAMLAAFVHALEEAP